MLRFSVKSSRNYTKGTKRNITTKKAPISDLKNTEKNY
jgi:hypothetical protein